MLNVLFFEQNNDNQNFTEQKIIEYCHLIEHLQLGYLNQSNSNRKKNTKNFFGNLFLFFF
jgi:hypothetical protein